MRRALPRSALLSLALLAGCTVGPNFQSPKTSTPASWGATPADVPSRITYGGEVDTSWWKSFGDARLTSLVDRLAAQNLDLMVAAERVEQARAERRIAGAAGLPAIGAQGQYTHTRISPNGTASQNVPRPGAKPEFDIYQPQVQASWELDLFGKVRRAVEAANARTVAAEEARNGIALSSIAELCSTYLNLRQLQRQEQVLRATIAAAEDRVRLTRDRFRHGAADDLDVAQAEAQLAAIRQNLPDLIAQEAAAINAIGLLLGEQPRALSAELTPVTAIPPVPPAVPTGLPADLIRRRPDIRRAEADLHAATADTGVAVASFFPSVSIGGSFGFQSLHPGNLFDWFSRTFAIAPTLNLPIFQGGRLTGTLELRKSQQREAALSYRQTVLGAMRDVDDALTDYARGQETRANTAATVTANERALAVAQQQYRWGAVNFLNVIAAQSALLQSQQELVRADARVATNLVTLYKALGGGWEGLPPVKPATVGASG